MTKEIPLSLQVFHSRNEYEAERLNRTEQIRLRDLHDVLKREEKLYVKDQALFKQRFQSHYSRGRFDPGNPYANITKSHSARISTSRNDARPISVSSIFSAPGKLQTNRSSSVDHSLASKMCSSFGEIPTLTRFQRVQRKFSLASFTENGLLTKSGSKMSKDIDKAREILFKRSNGRFEFPKINVGDDSTDMILPATTKPGPFGKDNSNQLESGTSECGNNVDLNVRKDPINSSASGREDQRQTVDSNKVVPETVEEIKPSNGDKTERRNEHSLKSIAEESPKPRSRLKAEPKYSTDTKENNPSSQSLPKKKVTILPHVNENETNDQNDDAFDDRVNETTRDFSEWRPLFSKSFKRMDPLQQRINVFLSDQKDFNKIFPKRDDGVTEKSALHNELASIGKEKREQESRDKKKRNEIVLEVLNKLGIEDEHIISLYQD